MCDLRATFVRPLKWLGRSVVAGTQKVMFLCNCCSTTLVPSKNDQSCCNGTTGRTKKAEWRQNHCHGGLSVAVVAEWRHSGRHSDRSMDAIGRPKDTMVVQGRQTCRSNWYTMFAFFTGLPMADHWPLCIHSATTAMCVPSSCLLWATCERPTSSATFVRLFWTCSKLHGDHGVHGDVWTSYVPPLSDQGNRSASLLPSTATWPVLWLHKGGTKVAAPVLRGYKWVEALGQGPILMAIFHRNSQLLWQFRFALIQIITKRSLQIFARDTSYHMCQFGVRLFVAQAYFNPLRPSDAHIRQ